ncbi:MAG: guanylate kinase [Chitinivibrionales bacterium]|nr:guanylate kinase [Chitinivibrionales bacterium]MBD3356746.1 guanylate kinase [Chitinivibrionales bacterium]
MIVFSAPSGAGKTTLLDHIRRTVPGLVYSISATTRPPRPNEVDGRHYFFLSEQEFHRKIEGDEFAEWQAVHGHLYGTPRYFVDRTIESGKHLVMDIDVYGKKMFDRHYPQASGILILPPSMDELTRRLRNRGTESEESIGVRLANAKKEIAFAQTEGKYEYTLVNDDLERAKAEVESVVHEIIDS